VQFTLGLRFQQINAWNFNATTGAVTSSYNEAATTPMFGLVVKPLQNVSVYANYIQGLQQGPVAPLGTVNAGQIFAPFTAQQYEAGVKVDWGKLTTTFAAYQITQPSGFISPTTNIFGVDGEQRNRGLEFNVFGEPTEGVRLLGGLSYIDARLVKTQGGLNQGNYAVGIPAFQLVAGGEWDLPFLKGLTVLGRFTYDSSAFIDAMNVQQVPEWAQLNLGARYTFERANGQPIVIRANVDNVFNANYWNATSFGQLSLSSPRTFLLAASFNF
jgi:iron complex outermembrane receptor protein